MSAADVTTAPMLPSELNFALPPSIPAGWQTKQLRVQTISTYPTSVVQGNEFQIQIPQLPNTFLDPSSSYLNIRCRFSWTTAAAMDPASATANPVLMGSGWSLFQRFEVLYNNQELIDQIMYPGVAFNAMANMTMSSAERTAAPHLGFGAVSSAHPNIATILFTGDGVSRSAASGNTVHSAYLDLAIPLLGVIGHATDKLIPAFLGGFRIDLTADAIDNYLKKGSVAYTGMTLNIQNIEFVCNAVTVDAGSLSAIIQQHPESLFIRTQSWVHSSQVIAAGTGAGLQELLISSRVSSMKHLLVCPSPSAAYEGIYSGVNPFLTSGTAVNINNNYYPQATHDPLTRPMDFFASNKLALNTLYCANHGGCIKKNQFLVAADASGMYFKYTPLNGTAGAASVTVTDFNAAVNAFYWIQSTEVFGRKASLLSGVDTKSGSNFLRLQIGTALDAAVGTWTFNMFACHDVILQCDLQTRRITRKI